MGVCQSLSLPHGWRWAEDGAGRGTELPGPACQSKVWLKKDLVAPVPELGPPGSTLHARQQCPQHVPISHGRSVGLGTRRCPASTEGKPKSASDPQNRPGYEAPVHKAACAGALLAPSLEPSARARPAGSARGRLPGAGLGAIAVGRELAARGAGVAGLCPPSRTVVSQPLGRGRPSPRLRPPGRPFSWHFASLPRTVTRSR